MTEDFGNLELKGHVQDLLYIQQSITNYKITEHTKLQDSISLGHSNELCQDGTWSKHLYYPDNTHSYLCIWRQLTESGFSRDPLFSISKTLQFLAKYCQSSHSRSSLFLLSIFIASGSGLKNCSIIQNTYKKITNL